MSDETALAIAALKRNDFTNAVRQINGLATRQSLTLQQFLIKGLAALALKDWLLASDTFAAATEKFPDQPQLWLNRGTACENLNRLDEAISAYQRCLALDDNQGEAAGNLSNLLFRRKRFAEAEQAARQALTAGAGQGQALNSLALALGRQGKFAAAEQALDKALQASPHNTDFLTNRANLAVDQLKFAEAWQYFAAARVQDDRAIIRKDEALARLLAGDPSGWPLFEARLELPDALRLRPSLPRWQGESLAGKKLLIVAEQGFGDTIQFCRYGQALAAQGADLVWLVQEPLKDLLAASLPGLVLAEGEQPPACDFWSPMLSLAWRLGLPAVAMPYLKIPPVSKERAPKKIGLVWAGSPTHERDHERSIPLALFKPLFERIDADFVAPFTGQALEQITPDLSVQRLDGQLKDFAVTAKMLAQLDCLIAVDTALAHLAGALGIKTYLLLPYCLDWRWGIGGETTHWYPSLTLLRQKSYGDWEGVIGRLVARLDGLTINS